MMLHDTPMILHVGSCQASKSMYAKVGGSRLQKEPDKAKGGRTGRARSTARRSAPALRPEELRGDLYL